MPLRAFIDGVEIIAPSLSEAEWEALREQVVERGSQITLPCCGAEGFLRRNHLGTQHFAHKPGGPSCDMQGETFEHLKAKADIVQACKHAGFEASTEIPGDGWRADVLASRSKVRIAFEVQWSFLRLEDCEYRQERYARDEVRGCWFFRKPPPALQRGNELKARRDLPLFKLVANANGSFGVRLNHQLYPLTDFVAMLLRGQVRFCEHAVARRMQRVEGLCFDLACPRCGFRSIVYGVSSHIVTDCGLILDSRHSDCHLMFDANVLLALSRYRETSEGRRLRMADVKQREGRGFTQACFQCERVFEPEQIQEAFLPLLKNHEESFWAGRFEAELPMTEEFKSRFSHWCYPKTGSAYCCESSSSSA